MDDPNAHQCPKCDSAMEQGSILSQAGAAFLGGSYEQQKWIEGTPVRSWLGALRTYGRQRRIVTSWRCANCGFLEFYANEMGS